MNPFLVWLFNRGGLDAHAYRPQALHRRLKACLRRLRVESEEEAMVLLEKRPELLPRALSSVLICVSSFFRDEPVFNYLERALPALLAARDGLRVLSAGVSDGQELYSIAMLLGEAGFLETSEILGLDCRADAIAHARAGRYTAEQLSGLSPSRWGRWFVSKQGGYEVAPELRENTQWRVGDLFAPGNATWDMVFFRNVSIYMEANHATRAWRTLTDRLVSGGLIVTGKAERPPSDLPLRRVSPCIYEKGGMT